MLEVFLGVAVLAGAIVLAAGAADAAALGAGAPAEAPAGAVDEAGAALISLAVFLLLLLFLVAVVDVSALAPVFDDGAAGVSVAPASLAAFFLLLFFDVPPALSVPAVFSASAAAELFLLFFELLAEVAPPAGSSPAPVASAGFFFELFFDDVELVEASALDSDFVFLDMEDFVVVSEVAADWPDEEASACDFLDFFLLVLASVLWSVLDCGRAKAGKTDNASSRLAAAVSTLALFRSRVIMVSLQALERTE